MIDDEELNERENFFKKNMTYYSNKGDERECYKKKVMRGNNGEFDLRGEVKIREWDHAFGPLCTFRRLI